MAWIRDGYILVWYKGKERLQHRIVMEEYIGRKLTKLEVVHHVNGNKLDNELDNLLVLTPNEHARLHETGKSHKGRVSEEARQRMSEQTKQRWKEGVYDNPAPLSAEARAKLSNSMKQRWKDGTQKPRPPLSAEERAMHSERMKRFHEERRIKKQMEENK